MINSKIYAQEKSEAIKLFTIYPGYIETNSNDTVNGYLLLKNKVANKKEGSQWPNLEKIIMEYNDWYIKHH
jgi:hypothetical protein